MRFTYFLRVTFENCHHLFSVLVENSSIFVSATRQNLASVRAMNIKCQDSRYTGRMQSLEQLHV